MDAFDRFVSKFKMGDDCWEWTAATDKGYGKFFLGGWMQLAHRVSYSFFVGPIPSGLSLDHLCRNTFCVRPAHLEPVTHLENMSRGANALKTHCPSGHEYSGENLYVNPSGSRECRTCRKANR